MEKDLSEGLYKARPLIKKMNRDAPTDHASAKDFENIEYEEMLTDREIEEQDELDTQDELDYQLQGLDDGTIPESTYKPVKNDLRSVLVRIVEKATGAGILKQGWTKDEDYVDAVCDKVKEVINVPTAQVKQSIRQLYGS